MKEIHSKIIWGEELFSYAFPDPHPMSLKRLESFAEELEKIKTPLEMEKPKSASFEEITMFHTPEYVRFVQEKSKTGDDYLDYGDTPAFKGCYEAASYVVGSSMEGIDLILGHEYKHVFLPMGGLHHARRNAAGGFCIFNDIGVDIIYAREKYGIKDILYIDIDAHHGDGVFYEFLNDPHIYIADVHEDGRFLYPGTGRRDERGEGLAYGTKLNIPLLPGSGDDELLLAYEEVKNFAWEIKVDLTILQAGVDGIRGDPIADLNYTVEGYEKFIVGIHHLAHEICGGKLLILGGGGYNPENTKNGWIKIVELLSREH
ncbi:MAG TPA: acetoin utilization protein AcuC [Dictyoglomaceae bacterium]|nr:acetoin utilization protein AcuC [Dictyoglomaceae bacterium]HPU44011.1 acetoin utilization protein AcuC [Dictyoglomaceae bacterium]